MAPTRVPVRPRDGQALADRCCEAAARLGAFGERLLAWLNRGKITELRVNQAKLMLLDRYIAERNGSPAGHRDQVVGAGGQLCVHGQFLALYHRLHTIQVETFPPPLASAAKAAKVAGEASVTASPPPPQTHLPPEVRLPED